MRLRGYTSVACREIEAGERSNLIIAVGDLALRYPNLLEPWTSHIYAPLSDPDIGMLQTAAPATQRYDQSWRIPRKGCVTAGPAYSGTLSICRGLSSCFG